MAIVIGDEIKGFNPTSADRKAGWKEGWKAFPIREVRVFPLFHLQGGQPSPCRVLQVNKNTAIGVLTSKDLTKR